MNFFITCIYWITFWATASWKPWRQFHLSVWNIAHFEYFTPKLHTMGVMTYTDVLLVEPSQRNEQYPSQITRRSPSDRLQLLNQAKYVLSHWDILIIVDIHWEYWIDLNLSESDIRIRNLRALLHLNMAYLVKRQQQDSSFTLKLLEEERLSWDKLIFCLAAAASVRKIPPCVSRIYFKFC